MGRHIGLRPDSAAHKIICMLVNLGGACTKARLLAQLPAESNDSFNRKVTLTLLRYDYVIADRFSLSATQAGKDYVAQYHELTAPAEPVYIGEIAQPRVAQPRKPLDFAKLYGVGPRRDGASDHRDIPSLMGNQRVLPRIGVVADDA